MGLRRTSHAVYDSQYSLVWAPKYRKWILGGDLRAYVDKLFHRIAGVTPVSWTVSGLVVKPVRGVLFLLVL